MTNQHTFSKKAGEVFHLDEWQVFIYSAAICWEQDELPGDPGLPGDDCRVVRSFRVTIEAAQAARDE